VSRWPAPALSGTALPSNNRDFWRGNALSGIGWQVFAVGSQADDPAPRKRRGARTPPIGMIGGFRSILHSERATGKGSRPANLLRIVT
jgi:hypothetical protein